MRLGEGLQLCHKLILLFIKDKRARIKMIYDLLASDFQSNPSHRIVLKLSIVALLLCVVNTNLNLHN